MILSKTKERTLDAVETEGGIVLIERVRYVPHGYTKGKWNDDRVFLTAIATNQQAIISAAYNRSAEKIAAAKQIGLLVR